MILMVQNLLFSFTEIVWYHRILLNRPLRIILVMGIFAIIIPAVVFFFLYESIYISSSVTDGFSAGTCGHNETHRIICGIQNATEQECTPNCCYDEENNFCYHYMPSRYSYISRGGWNETSNLTARIPTTPYKLTKSVPILKLHVKEISDSHLKIVVYDTLKINYDEESVIEDKKYFYKVFYPEVFIEVFSADIDNNITKPLMTTVRGPLIASKNIWEWTFHMGDEIVYGMGDLIMKPNSHKLIYNINGTSNALPFIMSQRNGTFSGLLIEQNGPLQINMTESKVVSMKSFSGDSISVHYFFGPRPEDVTRQLVKHIGERDVPPYWALGVHFCRTEAEKTNTTWMLERYENFTKSAEKSKLPYDSDCVSDELFQYLNFDLNNTEIVQVLDKVNTLQANGRHFMPTLRPHLRFDNESEIVKSAIDEGILFLNANDGAPVEGILDGEIVYFPDYSLEKTKLWVEKNWPFANMTDSFILKDNWPRNDNRSDVNCTVILPYVTKEINRTFCLSIPWNSVNSLDNNTYHMDTHNTYGMLHASSIKHSINISTTQREKNLTNFILSSSNFITYSVGNNMQNINGTWESMKLLFRKASGNSISGIFVQSIPICGDTKYFDNKKMEELCIKWYMASVILPIFRVTSYNGSRDPFSFTGYGEKAMKRAISMRYSLLPYYYRYLSENRPLLRPMFYDFYNDNNTLTIEDQYMVGDALLAVPSFIAQESTLRLYIPANETFYELWGGSQYNSSTNGSWYEIAIAETELPILLRGGHILAIQENTVLTAEETRLTSNYTVVVGIACDEEVNKTCSANGALYIANNTYWNFNATDEEITINPNLYSTRPYTCSTTEPNDKVVSSGVIDKIKIYGLNEKINNFENSFIVSGLNIDLCALGDMDVHTYTYKK